MVQRKQVLLLGAGRMGVLHARNLAQEPSVALVCIADVNLEAAVRLADALGVAHTDDIDAAIATPEIDAVFIATSSDTHVDLIVKAARAGKAVFSEKPIDLDLARVDQCIAEVERAGVPLMIGFNRRFDPSFSALRTRLHQGEIGDIEIVRITSRDPAPPPADYLPTSGGLFRDMMIHDFDTARWLLGEEPVTLHATASNLVDPKIAELGDFDTAVVTMRTARGAICTIDNSRRAVYGYDQRIEVLGSLGMLEAQNPRPTTVRASTVERIAGDTLPYHFVERYVDAFRLESQRFAAVLAGEVEPSPTASDGRRALILAEAALRSLTTGATVEVPA